MVHHSTGFTPEELHFGKREQDEAEKIIEYPRTKIIEHGEIKRKEKHTKN